MIGIASNTRIAWVLRLGKDFVDIVFPFTEPYKENLCFHKIAQVLGSQQFNHHFRMCNREILIRGDWFYEDGTLQKSLEKE